jgi:hypothetical protein
MEREGNIRNTQLVDVDEVIWDGTADIVRLNVRMLHTLWICAWHLQGNDPLGVRFHNWAGLRCCC